MAPGFPAEQFPPVYRREDDLPFTPYGNEPRITGTGNVYRVKRSSGSDDTQIYARKSLTIDEPGSRGLDDAMRKIQKEAEILRRARHGHVIELIETHFFESAEDTRFLMIMEYADTNLGFYLKRKAPVKHMERLVGWFGCLMNVVAYIHGFGIRHRDIKPSNILIKGKRVLLADFGISKMGLGKTMPTTIPEFARARSPGYCAPEVEDGSTRGRSADIFSLGAVFLEMLIAHSYPQESPALEAILTSKGDRSYAKSSDQVRQFMDEIAHDFRPDEWFLKVLSHSREMLNVERDERPLAGTLNMAWQCLRSSDLPLSRCTCPGVGDVSSEGKLVGLCQTGSPEEVERYLASRQELIAVGAIQQASARGRAEIVQKLLAYGVDVNQLDYSGQTALHCAAGYGYEELVTLLLENGADVQQMDNEEQTALYCAAGGGNLQVVEILLRNGADIQAIDAEGRTALQLAASRGHTDVVRTLLNRGADAEAMDSKGRTALHFAAGHGSEKVVEMLLNVVNSNIISAHDTNGKTALDFAARGVRAGDKNYEAVSKLLIEGRSVRRQLYK
jgi:Protein kinase domain/Ankyrin repeats (3 copies)/Ankyrin repeats (many copies)